MKKLNVLESKTKKMSLANIEGRLTPTEMENVMAGSGFWDGVCISVGVATLWFPHPALLVGSAACIVYQGYK